MLGMYATNGLTGYRVTRHDGEMVRLTAYDRHGRPVDHKWRKITDVKLFRKPF